MNLLTPSSQPFPCINDIHRRIQSEVESLGSTRCGEFLTTGAFVFLDDPFSGLLEPAFDSMQRPYGMIDAVALNYVASNAENDSPDDVGIATIAYQEGFAFSQNPGGDTRFGRHAKSLHSAYGITGSLLAIRLDDDCDRFLGVVAAHSDTSFIGIDASDEWRMANALHEASAKLRMLLQLRRERLGRQELERYQQFLDTSLKYAKTPRTVAVTCEHFVRICEPLFQARAFYISFSGSDPGFWISNATHSQSQALDAFTRFSPEIQALTFNRKRQSVQLYDTLNSQFGDELVWCRVQHKIDNRTLTCIAGRKATSISDHWQPCDVALISQALAVAGLQLSRSEQFDQLISHLPKANDDTYARHYQFDFLAHILNDYFAFDQILLTKVKRKPNCYRICSDYVRGFGDHDAVMKSRPKEYNPANPIDERPDIMIRILHDFMNDCMKPVYEGKIEHEDSAFSLDRELNVGCDLKGYVYFIPCCTLDDGNGLTLESILHVGSKSGTTTLSPESLPLITTLSRRVAEWLVTERHRIATRTSRDIRDLDSCDHETCQKMCDMVARATASLGCTLFLNASQLQLLGATNSSEEKLGEALLRLVNACENWDLLFGRESCRRLLAMFAGFLGISPESARQILVSAHGKHFGRLAAEVMYVRVCQSYSNSTIAELESLLEEMDALDRQEFVLRFGRYLLGNAYLPGFGLTGWVLRFRHKMSLADKRPASLIQFHKAVSERVGPPYCMSIRRMLKSAGVSGSTLEDKLCPVPVHADHISEDPMHQLPHDSYLACPIEGIEGVDKVLGVLRISNSATMRHRFTEDDEETVLAASRHISNLLRRAYMRQGEYLSRTLDRKGDEDEFHHCIMRLNEKIIDLRRYLHSANGILDGADRRSLEVTVNRLGELCDSALAGPQLRVLACRIGQSSTANMTLHAIVRFVEQWLLTEHVGASIVVDNHDRLAGLTPEVVTWICRVVVELVRNLKRHQDIKRPLVAVRTEVIPTFYISDEELLGKPVEYDWQPYLKLVEGKELGGGTRLIREAAELANLDVEFSTVSVGTRECMITRVRPNCS